MALALHRSARPVRRQRLLDDRRVRMAVRQQPRSARPIASAGSVCCIAGLLKSSSPVGLKSATASSRCSTAVCRLAFCPASSDRSAESCWLTVLKKRPSSPNSSPGGRSSVTPNSPLPRRVKTAAHARESAAAAAARKHAGDEHRDAERRGHREQRAPEQFFELRCASAAWRRRSGSSRTPRRRASAAARTSSVRPSPV